jgi:hypothetical protein
VPENLYSTIRAVRRIAGKRVKREIRIRIGDGDGSNTTFYLLNGHMCDGNGDQVIDTNDVTVETGADLDNLSTATITDLYPDSGKIILSVAPTNGHIVVITYWYSDVPDSEVIEEIRNASKRIELKTRTKFDREQSVTEKWDGDGIKKTFHFKKGHPVYQIDSYSIDSETSGLTEGEDYWLYPDSSRALWITFYNAPLADAQNVQLTYKYGEQNALVNEWVTKAAARSLILNELGSRGNVGTYIAPDADEVVFTSDKTYSLYRLLGDEMKTLEEDIGGKIGIEVVRNQ